ncbi:unnamed protein product [Medioppia subpectinata]|uniref:Uncharacterized protein n=1 Tax=Medioppia subpectinata TaxID=1979941 RepID=A0A7R9KIM9_9ACAR|nr:unnamed protein product [Medioppia subpectinata]CAG2104390.1 unnamed protein product [Medioppia subpectinata]
MRESPTPVCVAITSGTTSSCGRRSQTTTTHSYRVAIDITRDPQIMSKTTHAMDDQKVVWNGWGTANGDKTTNGDIEGSGVGFKKSFVQSLILGISNNNSRTNSDSNSTNSVNSVSSQQSLNVLKSSPKIKVAPINDINDWPTLGEVHKPKNSKHNSSADETTANETPIPTSGEPSVPSTPNKLANNHINDSTPPSLQSMSSSNHLNSNSRDNSQTSQPQSSQDDEDSPNETPDRDGGHSSGAGTDSTTTITPRSAKKKGPKKWVPLEIGPPPQSKPHRSERSKPSLVSGRDRQSADDRTDRKDRDRPPERPRRDRREERK